jgi:subtilase family serine protease
MKLGFNSKGHNQTSQRTTNSVLLGNVRNTLASTTRIFKFFNKNSPDLNFTFDSVFNHFHKPPINDDFDHYHIFDGIEIPFDDSFLPKSSIVTKPYTPQQIKSAYSINNIIPLPGIRRPIVTVIGAYNNPYLARDITKFGQTFGLPPCNYQVYNLSKMFSSPWAMELTLDVQWVYAINPYAFIRVVCARSASTSDIFNAITFANNKKNFKPPIDTDVMTMSFGSTDNGKYGSLNNYFSNSNTVYIASSGDSSTVSFPSSSTNVLSIGGTSLSLNSNNNTRSSEKVWSFSGCGYSKSFTKPAYQPTLVNNNLRVTPDICCVADSKPGCYVVINLKYYSMGGTSLSAPIYAGILSLITQNRLNKRKGTFTSVANKTNSIQPILYNLANTNCYYDITQGSSGQTSSSVGFDAASGLGVLNFPNIIPKLS